MRLAIASLLVLTCCAPDGNAPPASKPSAAPSTSGTPSPPAPPSPDAVATLAGEWRIAGIDGKDFNEAYALTLSGDDSEIWWAPRCAGLVRRYVIEGAAIRIGPATSAKPREPGQPTAPVCAIGLPPRIGEVTRALDSATSIRRTPGNAIELAGGDHSLLLFSQ